MGSKKKDLNKRIRENISAVSDEELLGILNGSPRQYTRAAMNAAREEHAKRIRLQKGIDRSLEVNSGAADRAAVKAALGDCYIEIWREKDFQGEYLIIEGPVEYQSLRTGAVDWGDDIGSLRVGPNAFVLAFGDQDYKGAMMSCGPNEEVADLSGQEFNDEIESLKVINSIKVFDHLRMVSEEGDASE